MQSSMEKIITACITAFSSVQTNVMSMIEASAPYALGIIGTVLAVTIGIKVFKKLTAQA
ncbi:MAG: major coat protein [Lachnospiraceae bacterium]